MSNYTSCIKCMIIWEDTPDKRKCQVCGGDLHVVGDLVKARNLQRRFPAYKITCWDSGVGGQGSGSENLPKYGRGAQFLHGGSNMSFNDMYATSSPSHYAQRESGYVLPRDPFSKPSAQLSFGDSSGMRSLSPAASQSFSNSATMNFIQSLPEDERGRMVRSWVGGITNFKKEDGSSAEDGSVGPGGTSRASSLSDRGLSPGVSIPTDPRAMRPPSAPIRHSSEGYGDHFHPFRLPNRGFGSRWGGSYRGSGVGHALGNPNQTPLGSLHRIEDEASGSRELVELKRTGGPSGDETSSLSRRLHRQQYLGSRPSNYGDPKSTRAAATDKESAARSRSDGFTADAYGSPAPVKRQFKFCTMHLDTTHWSNDPDCLAAQKKCARGEEVDVLMKQASFAVVTACEKVLQEEKKNAEGSKAMRPAFGVRSPLSFYDLALHIAWQMRWIQKYFSYCEARDHLYNAIYDAILGTLEKVGGRSNGPLVMQGLLAQAQSLSQEVMVEYKALIVEMYEKVFINGLKRHTLGIISNDVLIDGWLANPRSLQLNEDDRKVMGEIWSRIQRLAGQCQENYDAVIVRSRTMGGAFSEYRLVRGGLMLIPVAMIQVANPEHKRWLHVLQYPNFQELKQTLLVLLHRHGYREDGEAAADTASG